MRALTKINSSAKCSNLNENPCLFQGIFAHRGPHVETLELRLELVHDGRDLLQLHGVDGLAERLHHRPHVLRHLQFVLLVCRKIL